MADKKKKELEEEKLKEEETKEETKEENKEAAGNPEEESPESAEKEETAEAGETAEGSGEESKEETPESGKKDKMQEKLDELNDKVMRQMAEFDNFRRRSEKEKQAMFETGAKSVIEKLLPIVDNFERGLAAIQEEEAKTAFAEGMQKVYRQLMDELEKLEVKPIEAVGCEFDPNFHNAVMHVEDEEAGENVVVEELQKGYMYRENVVRHSMVKVAN
ncbi:MAG: nucleotide exchange factor GrpE [Lachnospiraceae bacterium]|nr:nucleotide exchange factor GrpE [Lachnospiraceae bacterium]